jgi:hypothetical protein
MILGALLDLGIPHAAFQQRIAKLNLPVDITIKEVKRASIRGLKVDVKVKKRGKPRKWADIKNLLQESPFSPQVKTRALDIFKRLFEAESHVHGREFSKAHLHEAGADDAIIDIVGCCWLAEELNIGKFFSSPLNVGRGWAKTSHGMLPVPPPAVGELLKGVPVYSKHIEHELVTPTGAAIVSTLADEFLPFPELCYQKIGYGAGSRDFHGFPNILRLFYGEIRQFRSNKKIYVIETNIDDENPQVLGHFLENVLRLGALDAFLTPIGMKKNRLGSKLTLIAELDKMDSLIEAVFRETSSIGIRYYPVRRRVLQRRIEKVRIREAEIPVKVAYLGGKEVNIQPEFSACQRIAKKHNRPVKDILLLVRQEYEKTRSKDNTKRTASKESKE